MVTIISLQWLLLLLWLLGICITGGWWVHEEFVSKDGWIYFVGALHVLWESFKDHTYFLCPFMTHKWYNNVCDYNTTYYGWRHKV